MYLIRWGLHGHSVVPSSKLRATELFCLGHCQSGGKSCRLGADIEGRESARNL